MMEITLEGTCYACQRSTVTTKIELVTKSVSLCKNCLLSVENDLTIKARESLQITVDYKRRTLNDNRTIKLKPGDLK